MIEESELRQRAQRIADLVHRLDSVADPGVRAQFKELLGSVMDFHGEALERLIHRLKAHSEAGEAILSSLTEDPVVASVLLLHDLHPVDFDTRVRRAIEKLGPALRSQGARAEPIDIQGTAVRIRIHAVDNAHTARTVRSAIEEELYAAAPEIESLVLVGLDQFAAADFVPLEKVGVLSFGKIGG